MSFELSRVRNQLRRYKEAKHVQRFWWNVTHLGSKKGNPYVRLNALKFRTAAQDISHSYVDIFVEFHRGNAYLMGHLDAVLIPAVLGYVVYLLI